MPFLEVETNMDSELPYGPMFPAIASRERHNIRPSSMDLTKQLLLQNSYFSKIQLSSLLSYFFIYLFLVGLGTHCCERAFSSCSKWGYFFTAGLGLLTVVASLCATLALGTRAPAVAAYWLSSYA